MSLHYRLIDGPRAFKNNHETRDQDRLKGHAMRCSSLAAERLRVHQYGLKHKPQCAKDGLIHQVDG